MRPLLLFTLFILSSAFSYGSVTASFSTDTSKGCSPLVIHLTNHSSPTVTSWHWDFGNGNTSALQHPSASYFSAGLYTIRLLVSDGQFTDSTSQQIRVFQSAVVNFIADKYNACINDTIHFTNQITVGDAPIKQYGWGFGNGIACHDTNTLYSYNMAGAYTITLIVQDTNGCVTNKTSNNFINIWSSPTAACTPSPATSCGFQQLITFNNQSAGTGLSYQWFFGDSTFSSTSSPTHLYHFGSYNTKLIVTDSHGCHDTLKKGVSVININADFLASKTKACVGEVINFYSLSPMAGSTWYWDFGDNNSSVKQNPKKIYNDTGVYTIRHVIKDGICGDTLVKIQYIKITKGFKVTFASDTQQSCGSALPVHFTNTTPGGVSFQWDFGNGSLSNSPNDSTTYSLPASYTVTLTVVDSNGCTVVGSAPGMINTTIPIVKFFGDTLSCLNAPIHFTNRCKNSTRFFWYFGDGDSSTDVNPVHTYTHYGRYTISLIAFDSLGCWDSMIKPSYVHIDSTHVDFTVNRKFSMCPPLVSIFTNQSNRPDLKYYWDFGDGYTDTAANPTHIYFHAGIFSVKLIGTSKAGCTDTIFYPNLIEVQGPSGTFSLTPNNGCIPLVVNFTGTISANTKSMICDLGDGIILNDSLNFSHSYDSVRIYHPRFILSDHIGCLVPYVLDSIITHSVPVLQVTDTVICPGQKVLVKLGSDHYTWQSYKYIREDGGNKKQPLPNNGFCDTCNQNILSPTDSASYIITATNLYGCSISATLDIAVVPLPNLVAHDTIKLCKGESLDINIEKAASVKWTPSSYLNDSTSFHPHCKPATSIEYQVTAYNNLGCSTTQSIPVQVIEKINATVSSDTAVCPNNKVQLSITTIDTSIIGAHFAWSPSQLLDQSNIANPLAVMQDHDQVFKLIITSGLCIADTESIHVHINPQPIIHASGGTTTNPNAEIPLTVASAESLQYRWIAKDSLSCHDCKNPILYPLESQTVNVIATNIYGCIANDSLLIQVTNCDPTAIFVPNTFTPNGDGQNDKLYMRSKTVHQLNYFRVFDRWGAVVFETTQNTDGWDGYINGALAQEGVYVYHIQGKCDNDYDVHTSGSITLIR